jgi:hypothetical protein
MSMVREAALNELMARLREILEAEVNSALDALLEESERYSASKGRIHRVDQ